MDVDIIPDPVRRFIITSIDSVLHLETLLLYRNNPKKEWNASTLAKDLYTDPKTANELLTKLKSEGFLTTRREGNLEYYRFEPNSEGKREIVDLVAEAYSKHLIPITELIHSKTSKVKQFADAFKLR